LSLFEVTYTPSLSSLIVICIPNLLIYTETLSSYLVTMGSMLIGDLFLNILLITSSLKFSNVLSVMVFSAPLFT